MAATKKQTSSQKIVAITLSKYEDKHFIDTTKRVWNYSLFNEEDINNFSRGTLYNEYEKIVSHQLELLNTKGIYFAV